jgi:hypothetical protein
VARSAFGTSEADVTTNTVSSADRFTAGRISTLLNSPALRSIDSI